MILPSREVMPVVRAALERGRRVRLTVNGSSMLPFIRDGDTVELEPLHSAPQLGDVVLAERTDGRHVVHRVVRVRGDTFFLRGDAQLFREGPFASSAALSRVPAAWHNGRARDLERGLWRLAGLAWVRTSPLAVFLLHVALPLVRLGRCAQRRLWHIRRRT
jgi:signal peptidase